MMPAHSSLSAQLSRRSARRITLFGVAVLVVVGAMALDTKVVKIGSADDVQEQTFSPESFGAKAFPDIQKSVESRAVDAATLATALKRDQQAAVKQYGVGAPLPVIPVTLKAVVGEGKMGVFVLNAAGVPDTIQIRLQTGPAITGTDLRDATGTVKFGDFKNQIEFQNAGSAINRAMKTAVLTTLDRNALTGKTIQVTGVFRLLNPNSWLITPVRIDVQ